MSASSRVHPTRRLFVAGALAALVASGCGYFIKTRTPSLEARTRAPAFTLPAHTGENVSLADLTKNGPAVIVFYRGFW